MIAKHQVCKTKTTKVEQNNRIAGAIVIDAARCKGCELCMAACLKGVIALAMRVNQAGFRYAEAQNPDVCIGCAACGIVCPDGCIEVYRGRKEVQS